MDNGQAQDNVLLSYFAKRKRVVLSKWHSKEIISKKAIRFRKAEAFKTFRVVESATHIVPQSNKLKELMNTYQLDSLTVAYVHNFVSRSFAVVTAPIGEDIQVSGTTLFYNQPWDLQVNVVLQVVIESALRKGSCTVVDAGANIGSTVALHSAVAGCKVLAFELQHVPRNYIRLAAHINGVSNSLRLYGPISSTPKSVCYIPNTKHLAGLSTVDQINNQYRKQGRIKQFDNSGRRCSETTRLDDVLEENNVRSIEFMKLDVDGPEIDVLKSLGAFLEQHSVQNLVVELHPLDKERLEFILQNGFTCAQLCTPKSSNQGVAYYVKFLRKIKETAMNMGKNIYHETKCSIQYGLANSGDAWCWNDVGTTLEFDRLISKFEMHNVDGRF